MKSKSRNKICVPDIEYESDTEHAQIVQSSVEVHVGNVNGGNSDREMDGVCELESRTRKDQTSTVPVENDEMIKKVSVLLHMHVQLHKVCVKVTRYTQ